MCHLSLSLSKVRSFQLFLSDNNEEIDENEEDNVQQT